MTQESGNDPSREAEGTVEELKQHGDKLAEDIDETKGDWDAKKESNTVPGAVSENPDPDEADQHDGQGDTPGNA